MAATQATLSFLQSRGPNAERHLKHGDKEAALATRPAEPSSSAPVTEEVIEAALRQWDLDSRFGPVSGLTRLQRWERAQALGLNPPPALKVLILEHGGSDSDFNRHLFEDGKV